MSIEEYLSRRGLYESYETLEQDRLTRTSTPDDAVDAPWLKGGVDVIQYDLVVKCLAELSDLYDLSPLSHSLT